MLNLSSVFKGEPDSRLFVQLMWKASAQYAPFMPSVIQLGDYGHVERSSGAFIREGNVLQQFPDLQDQFENVRQTEEAVRIFKQSYRDRTYQELDFNAYVITYGYILLKAMAYDKFL